MWLGSQRFGGPLVRSTENPPIATDLPSETAGHRDHTEDVSTTDVSRDMLFDGTVTIWQRVGGNRFALDTLLVAGALRIDEGARVLDLGSGNGALSLAVTHLYHPREVVGIEIQTSLVKLAEQNIRENGMEPIVRVVQGDVRRVREVITGQGFDAVVCNPPYYPSKSGRLNPDRERAIARHELSGTLGDFIRAAHYGLVPCGKLLTILPAFRLPDLLGTLGQTDLIPRWIQFVYPQPDQPASLVLLEARKGGAPRLVIRPPLSVRVGDEYSQPLKVLFSGTQPIYPGEEAST